MEQWLPASLSRCTLKGLVQPNHGRDRLYRCLPACLPACLSVRLPVCPAGDRQANINMAEGRKTAMILQSEAAMTDAINRAKGEEKGGAGGG